MRSGCKSQAQVRDSAAGVAVDAPRRRGGVGCLSNRKRKVIPPKRCFPGIKFQRYSPASRGRDVDETWTGRGRDVDGTWTKRGDVDGGRERDVTGRGRDVDEMWTGSRWDEDGM